MKTLSHLKTNQLISKVFLFSSFTIKCITNHDLAGAAEDNLADGFLIQSVQIWLLSEKLIDPPEGSVAGSELLEVGSQELIVGFAMVWIQTFEAVQTGPHCLYFRLCSTWTPFLLLESLNNTEWNITCQILCILSDE